MFIRLLNAFLPPANEVRGKVMFLHLSPILFRAGGDADPPLDTDSPDADPLPPKCRLPGCRHHPDADPLDADPPDADRLDADPSLDADTPRMQTPPDIVNKQAVCILLECILVCYFPSYLIQVISFNEMWLVGVWCGGVMPLKSDRGKKQVSIGLKC